MSYKLLNRARMSVSGAAGTGNITLGSAQGGCMSFASAGANDGDTFPYVIEDGVNWELGVGIYSASGPTITRNVLRQTNNSDNPIDCTSSAIIYCALQAQDVYMPAPPSIVQSSAVHGSNGGSGNAITLGASPTPGNLLVVMGWGYHNPTDPGVTVGADPGWVCIHDGGSDNIWAKQVVEGDTATITPYASGGWGAIAWEIAGAMAPQMWQYTGAFTSVTSLVLSLMGGPNTLTLGALILNSTGVTTIYEDGGGDGVVAGPAITTGSTSYGNIQCPSAFSNTYAELGGAGNITATFSASVTGVFLVVNLLPAVVPGLPTAGAPVSPYRPPLPTESP